MDQRKEGVVDAFYCCGKRVFIPRTADIPWSLRPYGVYAQDVQSVLNGVEPWETGEDPIETEGLDGCPVGPMAVRVPPGCTRAWGVHVAHKAKTPGLSPFVPREAPGIEFVRGVITVELTGSPGQPILTRAYGGEYTPPLPWMTSAGNAPGGRAECLRYWRKYAYVVSSAVLIRSGTLTTVPPEWFSQP